jgi:exopolysaccharide biosynthesis polyprenyl glycosylphosphotransferase
MDQKTSTAGASPPTPARVTPPGQAASARRPRPKVDRRLLVDIGALGLGLAVARILGPHSLSGSGIKWAALFIVLTFVTLRFQGLYVDRLRMSPFDDFSRIVEATSLSAMLLVVARFLGSSNDGAASQAARLWVGSTICICAGRVAYAAFTRRRHRSGVGQRRLLIIGADRVGRQIAARLIEHPELGLCPVGFLDDAPSRFEGVVETTPGVPQPVVLGSTAEVEQVVLEGRIESVIVAFANAELEPLQSAIRRCRAMGLQVSIVPRFLEDVSKWIEVEHLGGIPLMRSRTIDPRGWRFRLKYALDPIAAAVLLLFCAPVMIAIAIAVRVTSPGPILFRQPRVSLDGREFNMLKFRSMRGDPAGDGEWDAGWAAGLTTDPSAEQIVPQDRRTPIGRFLRRSSLDELPQLLNVLRGDMSLVGPRPERLAYVRAFNERVYRYPDRHRVKSGLTGWAQVHGLRGETSLADRVEWDNYYIENWSLRLDFKILILTPIAAVSRRAGIG